MSRKRRRFAAAVMAAAAAISVASAEALQVDYSVIRDTGKSCPGRDSCRETRNNRFLEIDWKKRNCFCDNDCAMYGDCCIDAPSYRAEEQDARSLLFQCTNLKQYGDIYMRGRCPRDWSLPNIRKACESPEQVSDPFGTTPVTNPDTGVTYRNYYCAVCNGDARILFWQPRLECPTLTGYSKRFQNLTTDFIADRLVFDKARGQWGVELDTGGIPVFHECYIDPAAPETIVQRIRTCRGVKTIMDCPEGHPNPHTLELCRSYTAVMFAPSSAYRNVHCAICNGADLNSLICLNLSPYGRFNWQQNFNSFAFAVLFDINGDLTASVGQRCGEGELYDPFFRKCRNVVCARETDVFSDGRCVNALDVIASTTTTTTTSTTTITTTTTTATTTTTISTTQTTTTIATTTPSTTATTTEATVISSTTSLPSPPSVAPTTSASESPPTAETTTSRPRPLPSKPTTSNSPKSPSTSPSTTSTRQPQSAPILTCQKVLLEVGEFEMDAGNTTVFVPAYDKSFNSSSFEISGERILICVFEELADSVGESKFSPEMGYVTVAGLGVSIVCLVLHLVASSLAPELQNLSGKNLISLCISLLGGYSCFLANLFRTGGGRAEECISIAAAMFYFFLASFFWMLTIAFDVCRSLKIATKQLRLTSGTQWKKFFIYSVFAWLTPLLILIAALILDLMSDEVENEFKPRFGLNDLCWFGNKKALIVFFAVPFGVIMVTNVVLFFLSACMVYDTTKTGGGHGAAKITCSGHSRDNFRLYLRLAVIMGLTWITGLVAALLDAEPVWFGFVILNTLQGLFILLAFTCKRKVARSIRERLSVQDDAQSSSQQQHHPSSSVPSKYAPKRSSMTTLSSSGMVPASAAAAAAVSSAARKVPPSNNKQPVFNARGKTMYTVTRYQANGLTQNSFDGRYF